MERYRDIIPDFDEFLEAIDDPLPTTARVNSLKSNFDDVAQSFRELGLEVERMEWYENGIRIDGPTDFKIGNTLPYYLGWIHPQEEVSMIPPVVLSPSNDDLVLDTCAAPGSKTTQLAVKSGGVVANDDDIGRIAALRNNIDRLGVTNVGITNYDGRRIPGRGISKPCGKNEYVFDSAVVDVPCTSEGTVRKNPAMKEGADESQINSIRHVQTDILRRTIELVKSGGTIVYSTCTFAPEENEGVLDEVIDDVHVREFDIGLDSSPGVTEWEGEEFHEEVDKAKRFYPHKNDTGGFFVAKLEVV
ncbi:MAG: RsmB/NOP family class I SAM-dependent RNA methyltransferase [Halobacteria archaeon]|nr:RsmB/NOP family class I SAM-dependent RNA methyltransferase [Halobacteria archaeon]